MEVIDFAQANAFGIKLNKLSDETVWYSREYARAACMLQDIITENVFSFRNQEIDFDNSPEYNNIVAITGDRGSGKSTVMHTIMAHLDSSPCRKFEYSTKVLDDLTAHTGKKTAVKFTEKTFQVLPPLDPSKLPKGETLLGFTVAYLYNDIITMLKDQKYVGDDFTKVLNECEKTYEAIRIRTITISKGLEQNPDDLEMLGKLANTSTMRQRLMKLIAEYLELKKRPNRSDCESRPQIKHNFLVIPIDDIDTNIESGYRLAEEIRNFFFIPQVVVLMAVKLEQLTDVVQQHYISAFSKMLTPEKVLDAQPEEMATKYIQKLIPDQRRIHLHTLTPHALESIKVKTKALATAGDKGEPVPLVDYFFQLVWERCGILLTKNDSGGHGLIPLNLRSLHQAFELLEDMDCVDLYGMQSDAGQKMTLEKNIGRLEAWILDSVSSNAVPRGMAIIVRKIASHPNAGLNGSLVDLLVKYTIGEENKGYDADGKVVHRSIFGHDMVSRDLGGLDAIPDNISLGDVLYLLGMLERYNSNAGFMHFTAAVRFLYSLRLTEALFLTGTESEEGFNKAASILGGLVYNPAIPLTTTGQEWSPNMEVIGAMIKIPNQEEGLASGVDDSATGIGIYYLDGREVPAFEAESTKKTKNQSASLKEAMSLRDAVWLSNFIVHYGDRLKKNRLFFHHDGAYTETRFYKKSEEFMGYMSINWMGFVANALNPNKQAERFLSYGVNKVGQNLDCLFNAAGTDPLNEDWREAKTFIDDMNNWKKEYRVALPVYSVDVLDTLISRLQKNRYLKKEGIAEFKDFFTIKISVAEELTKSLQLTALQSIVTIPSPRNSSPDPHMTKEIIIKALEKFPVYDKAGDILKRYIPIRQADHLKFDWLL